MCSGINITNLSIIQLKNQLTVSMRHIGKLHKFLVAYSRKPPPRRLVLSQTSVLHAFDFIRSYHYSWECAACDHIEVFFMPNFDVDEVVVIYSDFSYPCLGLQTISSLLSLSLTRERH